MLDGGAVLTRVAKSFLFEDNIKSIFGGCYWLSKNWW
jgi:hypothetical protein